jgi:hypothetical protein
MTLIKDAHTHLKGGMRTASKIFQQVRLPRPTEKGCRRCLYGMCWFVVHGLGLQNPKRSAQSCAPKLFRKCAQNR